MQDGGHVDSIRLPWHTAAKQKRHMEREQTVVFRLQQAGWVDNEHVLSGEARKLLRARDVTPSVYCMASAEAQGVLKCVRRTCPSMKLLILSSRWSASGLACALRRPNNPDVATKTATQRKRHQSGVGTR